MSLEKAIKSGKEKRKPFRGSKSASRGCRCHGSCGYCLSNRMYSFQKLLDSAKDKLKDSESDS